MLAEPDDVSVSYKHLGNPFANQANRANVF